MVDGANAHPDPPSWQPSPLLAGVLSLITAAVAGWLIERPEVGRLGRVFVALLPTPFFLLLLVAMLRQTRQLDELSRQVQLEAVAITAMASAAATFLVGYLQRVDVLAVRTWDDVWLAMAVIYLGAWTWAARKYR